MKGVLFLCTHNAGRSQMAAGFARSLSQGRVHVLSGGSNPAEEVNSVAVDVMAEIGIDISEYRPQRWNEELLASVDVVVTMGCGDSCPFIPGKRYVDWAVEDPSGKSAEEVRRIRDDIGRRVADLLAQS